MKQSSLYICYYNISEPLVQSQALAYVRELAQRGVEMHLLTFERERFTAGQRRAIRDELSAHGIHWHSLRYHQRPSLPATLYDIALGTLAAAWICLRHRIRLAHARIHVPAAMALTLQCLIGCKFLFDLRGLFAEECVDAGRWPADSLKYRLTKRMERAFFRRADGFVMLTERIKDLLVKSEPSLRDRADAITVIPCCVDLSRFTASEEDRAAYRRARGWDDRLVLTYAGKLSHWYLLDEMAAFFAAARQSDPRFFFQILTQSEPELMRQALAAAGVSPADYDIRFAPPSALPLILAASGAGISLRRGEASKPAVSPTKLGECLAAGLPVVTNAGIGDCDRMLGDHRLGVILREFSDAEYRRAVGELVELLADADAARRCREFAERELSLARVGGPRYAAVYERLLGSPVAKAAAASEIA